MPTRTSHIGSVGGDVNGTQSLGITLGSNEYPVSIKLYNGSIYSGGYWRCVYYTSQSIGEPILRVSLNGYQFYSYNVKTNKGVPYTGSLGSATGGPWSIPYSSAVGMKGSALYISIDGSSTVAGLFLRDTVTVEIITNYETYTITWNRNNGTSDVTSSIVAGSTPDYQRDTGATEDPTKAEDPDWIYTFAGWSPTPYAANKNQTYVAQYNKTANHKTVKYWDGSQWVECYANVWDGSQWVEVEPRYWDGSQWVECTHGQGG